MAPLKSKSDIHIARKAWHIIGVLVLTFFIHDLPKELAVGMLSLCVAFFVLSDIARLRFQKLNDLIIFIMNPFLRESERNSFSGISFLLTGVLTILVFFNKEIVVLSLLCLAFGDPLASYVGVKFGTIKIFGNKSLQGSFAAFVICTILSAIFFTHSRLMVEHIVVVSPLAGLAAALSELIPIGAVDDNLTFPLISSVLFFILFHFFGAF